MTGILHNGNPGFAHRKVGEAVLEETGTTLLVLASVPLGTPHIVHPDGRTFELPWDGIISLADSAFFEDELKTFVEGYKEALLWSSVVGPEGPEESADNFEFSEAAASKCESDCRDFFTANTNDVRVAAKEYKPKNSEQKLAGFACAGHDFALTRNGHGAGFWDGDLSDELGKRLTEASKAASEVNVYLDSAGEISIV